MFNDLFIATSAFRGRWEGTLENDGANTPIKLSIDSNDEATLAIGMNRAEKIVEMRAEGEAVTGKSTGLITSPDVHMQSRLMRTERFS